MEKLNFGLLKDVECDACGVNVPIFLKFIAEKEGCFCKPCAGKNDEMVEEFEESESEQIRDFNVKLGRIGIPVSIRNALKLNVRNLEPELGGGLGESLAKYVSASLRGLVVLSGDNGVGKSTAAAWCAYMASQGAGRFLGRAKWMSMTTWGESGKEVEGLIQFPGVVVFDEVCASGAGDPIASIRIVTTVACQRHDQGKGTVLTTRASKQMFDQTYGNDVLDRTRAYVDTCGSGWITMKGKSRR